MIFDYSIIIQIIVPLVSVIALSISLYNFYQSIRKMEVDLWIDDEDRPAITVYAYNPSQKSVALKKIEYEINGKSVKIREGRHASDPSKYDGANEYCTSFVKKIDFPYILKSGDAVFITINARNLAGTLRYKGFSGKIKLSAYFETAQKKIHSKSTIEFNIEKYKQ